MRRRTFDFLATSIGAVLTVVLFVAAGLLLWGANFANTQVHNQLGAQKISFPPAVAFAHPQAGTEITPSMIPSVSQYAGLPLTTGAQAKVYADNFIQVHLNEVDHGATYAQESGKMFSPNAPKAGTAAYTTLQANIDTLFRGTMLRQALLTAYGFSVFGQIAGDASTIAFILGGVMLILTALGLLHYRRTDEAAPLLKGMDVPATIDPVRAKVPA